MTDAELEAMLGRLTPTAAAADPVAAAYAAGRAAGRRAANGRWGGVTAALLAASVSVVVARRPSPVAVVAPSPVVPAVRPEPFKFDPPPPGNAWQLRALVLADGVDALPRTTLVTLPATPAYGR